MRIPQSLINVKDSPIDVSIIIGESGSGKSTLLNDVARHYCLYNNVEILAIANSIHDKFDITSGNFNVLRGREGRRQAKKTIKNAIKNIAKKDIQRLKFASMALEYVGFDPAIGFKVPRLKIKNIHNYLEDLSSSQETSGADNDYKKRYLAEFNKKDIVYIYEKLERLQEKEKIWLSINEYSFEEIEKFSLTEIFVVESVLVKLKIIEPIEVYLSKNNKEISLLDASSGELSLIISLVYLSTIIEHNTVILIDEPENSLHPKWQREYVKNILDIFYLYEPKIIIATHSPTILNGAEVDIKNLDIYLAKNFEATLTKKDPKNIEEIYYDLFGITTPENRFLSKLLTEKLNNLADNNITIDMFNSFITEIEKTIYDDRQHVLIEGVNAIAIKIIKSRELDAR